MINSKLLDPRKLWGSIDVKRRAAVLAILYKDLQDEVSCILTTRSGHISYAGDAALPGGKADFAEETTLQVARREAYEEIGVPLDLKLTHMQTMPAYLSSRYLCVVPEVVMLDNCKINHSSNLPRVIDSNLVSSEVNKVFSVRLAKFLECKVYESKRENWSGLRFQQHYFRVPVREKKVGEPADILVWGLTANILIDIARTWYNREPAFEHRVPTQYGDQQLIEALAEKGHFQGPPPKGIPFRSVLGKENPLLDIRNVK